MIYSRDDVERLLVIYFTGNRPWTPDEGAEGMPKSERNPAHSCDDWAEFADISKAWQVSRVHLEYPTAIWLRLVGGYDMTKVAELTGVEYHQLCEMYLRDTDLLTRVINGDSPEA